MGRNRKGSKPLPSTFNLNGLLISDKRLIANGFNDFFSTIGPKLAQAIPTASIPENNFKKFLPSPPDEKFIFSPVSELQLMQHTKNLKSKWSHGDDLISNNLLKASIPYILQPLKNLINLSLKTGFVPEQIRVAKIIPLFKEGDPKEFNN